MKHLQGLQCHQSTMEFSLEKRGRGGGEGRCGGGGRGGGGGGGGQTPPTIVVSTFDYTSPEKL